jgi:hypothetical protein
MPPLPTKRAWLPRSIIFGVVPDEISEWKPDTAPHAMMMNRNGNSGPENTGPAPVGESRDRLHLQLGVNHVDADRPARR